MSSNGCKRQARARRYEFLIVMLEALMFHFFISLFPVFIVTFFIASGRNIFQSYQRAINFFRKERREEREKLRKLPSLGENCSAKSLALNRD